ncbi:MAG TPA: S8 family serine peptidase [Actinomycetota bacterium]|nr:S8 family serine peptidase [Actinomycetota bacterium]
MKRSVLFVLCLAVVATAAPAASASPARAERGRYIVVLRDSVGRSGNVAAEHAARYGAGVSFVYGTALKGYAATLTEPAAARISRDPRVAWVEPDRLMHATAQSLPTGVNRIEGDLSSQVAGNGSGAVSSPAVAIIDTGIDLDHPDLNVIASVNCTGGGPFRKKCGTGGDDDNGHGTHVAGTVGARDDSNGVVGVAPGAPLVAVKVLNSKGSGYTSWIAAGIDWVAANAASRGIKVANMSLGGSGSDDGNCGNSNNDAMHKSVCGLVNGSGVTLVAAAGNSTKDLAGFVPAAYDEVLTVTAVADFNGQPGGGAAATCRSDVDDTAADFSNWAVKAADQAHTIAAPGVCIRSTWLSGGYHTISGTSMASPHVAGTVALCLSSATCSGTPAQIASKLRTDAQNADASNAYGFVQDPNSSPITGRYYGYLEYAGGY